MRAAAAKGRSLALLGAGALLGLADSQFQPTGQQPTGCCDLYAAGYQWQHSPSSDDAACSSACTEHACGTGHITSYSHDHNEITCTCYHSTTPNCPPPPPPSCPWQNDRECDELIGDCAPGTDTADCHPSTENSAAATSYTQFGRPQTGRVAQAGGRAWFKFTAAAEHTYVLEAHGVQPGFDPYMQLYDSGQHLLAQNDDREMPNDNSLDSYIEWTCNADGVYIVSVSGYGQSTGAFTLDITPSATEPCSGGTTLTKSGGEISFESSGDRQTCSWSIICPDTAAVVSMDFGEFQLNRQDYVVLHDGPTAFLGQQRRKDDENPRLLAPPLTGSRADLQMNCGTTYVSSGSSLTVEFQSASQPASGHRQVSGEGFTASYMCSENVAYMGCAQGDGGPHGRREGDTFFMMLTVSLLLSVCTCMNVAQGRRRVARRAAGLGRSAPLVQTINATAVDVESAANPMADLVAMSSEADTTAVVLAGTPLGQRASVSAAAETPSPSPLPRSSSSGPGRWECPDCGRENPAYRTHCEGCPGPQASRTSSAASIVVQSSAVVGVAMETLSSFLNACSLQDFEPALRDIGVVEVSDLRSLSDAQLGEMGMKPVETDRLRRRLRGE